jgi:hypothetical protein
LLRFHRLLLLMMGADFRTELRLLVGGKDGVDLLAERVIRLRILRAAGRVLRGVLIQRVLHCLLLLLVEIDGGEQARPTLVLLLTGGFLPMDRDWLRSYLCRCPNRQGESRKQGGQTSDLHALMIRSGTLWVPEREIRSLQGPADGWRRL